MKSLFTKPLFKNWPIASIAYYCLQKDLLSVSLNSWYKYAKIFNIKLNNYRKRKYDIGIRASKPLQILHADVTLFKTLDNVRACIYIIVDNCSRYILDNNIRPHCGLKGLTPKKVLDDVKINKEKQRTIIKDAIRKRIAINTKFNCGLC